MLDLKALAEDTNVDGTLPSNIAVLSQTNQLKAMTTIIRDKDAETEDFIFYLERTSTLVLTQYLSLVNKLTKKGIGWLDVHTKGYRNSGWSFLQRPRIIRQSVCSRNCPCRRSHENILFPHLRRRSRR